MTDKEKLISLINESGACFYCYPLGDLGEKQAEKIADYLMDNGVAIPVRCKDCKWYNVAPYDNVPYCSHESGYCGEHMGGLFYCACGERKDNG